MLVTLLPMVTEVREEQLWKAQPPMLVTLLGIVIEVREEQEWKVLSPMLVTLLGIVMEVREEQEWKAPSPMRVKPSGRETEVISPATCSQGHSPLQYISPEPVMVRALVSVSYAHCKL